MKEIWKTIEKYPNYEISSEGRCRNKKTGRFLNRKTDKGYCRYTLGNKTIFVHRLVAEQFIPNPNNYPMINHKDEDKTNNSISNLEWCDNAYNIRYSFCKPIYSLDNASLELVYYGGMNDAERIDDYCHSTISKCCRGKKQTYRNKQFFFEPPTVDEYLSELKCCDVICSVDDDGNYEYYNGVRDAERKTGISSASICQCYQGKRKKAGKKKWVKF